MYKFFNIWLIITLGLLKIIWKNLLELRIPYYKWYDKKNSVCILYSSNNFLVVHKPYDMFINSNSPERKNTLQFVLKEMFPNLANPMLSHEFHFVHRLDYATSGIICIALNKRAARAASIAFEKQQVQKYYLALLHGHVNDSFIIIDKPIGDDIREIDGNKKMCTSNSLYCIKPRKSRTVLLVLEYGFRKCKPATKVLLCPKTGRRHQLRVHCASIGHTIIGDYTYSGRQDVEPHRTFLHSFRLILKNNVENLDLRTADPFISADSANKWQPTNIIRTLDENIFSEIHELAQ
ncbi:RNA pseudouridylate synthase domain-containing protein 1-like [Polistes fuscatus]|uniref:RNA pseudouridylate synthase domain-containing protein 1-like n=1 Tax=Polistes fuscatus TaxID=30207 RepID=UPI001CA91498|nr:RNA pseudouridylate synthase domain-containing protein 1-like [Polistes fuscatus]